MPRPPSAETMSESVWPVDQLHHQRAHALGVLEAVDLRDVRMIERREDLRFALEAGETIGIVGEDVRKDLDRDVALQLRVARAIDLAHAARAERSDDLVTPRRATRR